MDRYIGKPLRRFEDERLLRGHGCYLDDIRLPGMLYAAVLRSIHAHARIRSIDVAAASRSPGIAAVLTAQDILNAVKDIPAIRREGMEELRIPEHPVLAREKVFYVGQPVAVVVAQDRYAARDAVDLLEVEYESLPPLLDPLLAAKADTPPIHEIAGTNVAMRLRAGKGNVEEAFVQADRVFRARYEVPRLSAVPLETRGVVAQYQPEEDVLTLWTSTQVPHRVKRYLAELLVRQPKKIRVIAPDVGGGFGRKIEVWPEELALSYLAMLLGRPIKWTEDRMENFITTHGRGYVGDVEAAVKNDGTILAMRFRIVADLGAYLLTSTGGPLGNAVHRVAGPYAIPIMDVECLGVLTNKPPTGPYRGAGGPEAALLTERMVDLIARELRMDPVELRRKNLIRKDAFPYTTATDLTYDSGDFLPALDRALELAEYGKWRQVQKTRGPLEPLIGVGVATVVKASGGTGQTRTAVAKVTIEPSGQTKIYTEVSPHGQGSVTTFAQIAADVLGVSPEAVQVLHGDTDLLPTGQGTTSSRGLTVGGSAVYVALQEARKGVTQLASQLLGFPPEDVVLQDGQAFNRRNPEQGLSLAEIVSGATRLGMLPEGTGPGLEFNARYTLPANPYGFAAHMAVVEVDRETGNAKLLKYVAVQDIGPVINPMIVEGQIHGGIVQGIGQALSEAMIYDPMGQPLTGTLMDYAVPFAEDVPSLIVDRRETPSPTTPMGVKGIGELPTVASPSAVANAVSDALATLGVGDIDIPLSPEKVWRALQEVPVRASRSRVSAPNSRQGTPARPRRTR